MLPPFDTETDSDPDPDLASPLAFSDNAYLEVVRKGSRILNLTSPSGSGKPPAEGAVAFSTWPLGWVGAMPESPTLLGIFYSINRFRPTKAVVENGSDVSPFSPLPIHLCALCDLCGISPPSGSGDLFGRPLSSTILGLWHLSPFCTTPPTPGIFVHIPSMIGYTLLRHRCRTASVRLIRTSTRQSASRIQRICQ
jgi:hypothetical protein